MSEAPEAGVSSPTAPTPDAPAVADARAAFPTALGIAIASAVIVADIITKRYALATLPPRSVPHEVIGEYLRFTLAFNKGVAFGFHLGEASRWVFSILTLVILGVLLQLYRSALPEDRIRRLAISLVAGGAIGNLIDRVRWHEGVVDFIDVGVGSIRFWTFNVADMAVSTGAVLLIWVLQKEDNAARRVAEQARTAQADSA